MSIFFFFFNVTATTEIYTLSLHDALPIFFEATPPAFKIVIGKHEITKMKSNYAQGVPGELYFIRSEEHTSELQSQSNLVCRLLLEKKKETKKQTTPQRPPENITKSSKSIS